MEVGNLSFQNGEKVDKVGKYVATAVRKRLLLPSGVPVVMILSDQPLMFQTGRTSLRFGVVGIVKFSSMVLSMPVRLGRVRST